MVVRAGMGEVAGRLFAYVLDHLARPTRPAMAAHLAYLRALASRAILVVGGPFRDGGGAVVCVIADDEAAADAIARADPLVAFGFMLYQLHEIDRADALPLELR